MRAQAKRSIAVDHTATVEICGPRGLERLFRDVRADEDATGVVTVATGGTTDPRSLAAGGIHEPLARGTSIGRYVVLHRAGVGGMGEVYAAYDPELDRKVALKLLTTRAHRIDDTQASTRLLREAQALAKLSHPNVVAIYDAGTHGDRVFIAMEYIDGVTLQRWLAEQPRPWRVVLETLVHAGRALAAAHLGGIIHRDFKPANVMIHRDTSVRVLDFGLARRLGSTLPRDSNPVELDLVESSARAVDLTRTGLVSGTPAYMAPEQFTGENLDERTDQFSFCVALYEGLYRERPYAGEDHAATRRAVLEGRISPPPAQSRVPPRVRRCLVRGLAVEPAERFASMSALIDALERAARPRWRSAVAPLAAGVAVGLGALAYAAGTQHEEVAMPCVGVEDKLTQGWTESRRAEILHAFTATVKPYALDVLRRVELGVDAYAGAWVLQRRDACEATRVRGEQSEELLDRRMACLDDRLGELTALTDQLAHADAGLVEKAPDAVAKLGGLARCESSAVLSERIVPPPHEVVAEVAAVRTQLARAELLGVAGKYAEALTTSRAQAERARVLGYAPLLAEALQHQGALEAISGEPGLAEATLTEALLLAEAAGHDLVELKARIALASLMGIALARPDDGRVHARFAAAVAQRIGPSHGLVGTVALIEALVEYRAGNNTSAETTMLRALAEREQVRGPDHPDVAMVLVNLGAIQVGLGRLDDAMRTFERTSAIYEKTYGAHHPLLATSLNNLALTHYKSRHHAQALVLQERALAIWTAALAVNHPEIGKAHHNLATTLGALGRYDEALAHYQTALTVKVASVGANHPSVAASESNIGDIFNKLHRYGEALPHVERARAIIDGSLGPDHLDAATIYSTLGATELGLGHARAAAVVLMHAEAIMARQPGDESDLAEVRFALGRALWEDPDQRGTARTRVQQAHEVYARLGELFTADRAATEAWLGEHDAAP